MILRDARILCPVTLAHLVACVGLLLLLALPSIDRRKAGWSVPQPPLQRNGLRAAPPESGAAAVAAAPVAEAPRRPERGKARQEHAPKQAGRAAKLPPAPAVEEPAAAVELGPLAPSKIRPGCTPRKASTDLWNSCTPTSLSTAMCREPTDAHPPVSFFAGRAGDEMLRFYFTPRKAHIIHNGRPWNQDRICASAELVSLAVPLIYKDGWPLKKRQNITMELAYNDVGGCVTFSYVRPECGISRPIPDSAFWGRPDTFFPNYTQAVLDLKERSKVPPKIRKCLWAGNPDMHPKRFRFLQAAKNVTDLIDVHLVHGHWGLDPKMRKFAVPLGDQIEKWACMIDVQGGGFSGRVPLLLSSGRPLLVVRRRKNWDFDQMFYSFGDLPEKLQPWVHYAPVAEDFHDLAESARWILEPANAEMVARNAMAYAAKYLTLDYAVKYTAREMIRAMKAREREDEREEKRRKERAERAKLAAAGLLPQLPRLEAKPKGPPPPHRPAHAPAPPHPRYPHSPCTPRKASETIWNSCTADSLSTTMCAEPSQDPDRPEVLFGKGRCKDSWVCVEFEPRRVRIIHDGGSGNADRKCATAEMTSLAVPLVYKAGWPLKRRQNASLQISVKDIGDCLTTFSYVLACRGTSPPLPDSAFWGRPDTFFPNYTEAVIRLQALSRLAPKVHKCIWAGNAEMHPKRAHFVKAAANLTDLIDVNLVHGHWGVDPKLKKSALPLSRQVRRWACMIDLQGGGFSGRVPLLLSSGRPLLVVRRTAIQDFDKMFYTVGSVPEKLQPWVHYVPVSEDFSDLAKNARWILRPENGRRIAQNAMAYAAKYLTLDYAVNYTAKEMLRALKFADENDGKHKPPPFAR